jgi:hypothetical protein
MILSNGLGLLFLLWYITPRDYFQSPECGGLAKCER